MTVSELIERLKNYPGDMMVVIPGYEGGYDNPEVESNGSLVPDSNWNGDSKETWYNGRHDVYYVEMEENGVKPVQCVVIGRGK
jgi:hypothetical protein